MNGFVFSRDPVATYAQISGYIDRSPFAAEARVAYRAVEADEYTILRPAGLATFSAI